jgi:hypothetical protein
LIAATLWCGASSSRLVASDAALTPFCPGNDAEIEANDTPGGATPLTLTETTRGVYGEINPAGDVDYFSFTATAGQRLWLAIDTGVPALPGSTTRDSVVEVYAPGGALLERDDDDGTGNGRGTTVFSGEASLIAGLPLASSGTYLIRVSAQAPTAVLRPYSLIAALGANTAVAESEPNDTPASAQLLPGGRVAGSLSGPGDVDYYLASLLDAGQPFITVDGDPERDGIGTDLAVELRDQFFSPTQVLAIDSSAAGGSGNPPAEGALFGSFNTLVRVSGPQAGTYRIAVQWSGYCPVPVVLEKLELH